jgi:hypothetical protein
MSRLTKKDVEILKTQAGIAEQDPPKAMFRILCRAIREFDVIFIEKSRQIMMSWFFVAICVWMAAFQFNRRIFLQSKKQEDADQLTDRSRHIYDAIKAEVEPIIGHWLPKAKSTGLKSGTTDKLEFPAMGSIIQSIPQGPEIIRSYTPSVVLGDEMNHQPQFIEGYGAASPAIQGGGKYWGIGTPNGKTAAYAIIKGLDDRTLKPKGPHIIDSTKIEEPIITPPNNLTLEQQRYWIEKYILNLSDDEFDAIPFEQLAAIAPGIEYHKTVDDTDCIRIHYTADPDKDPITAKGAEWVKEAKKKMKSQSKWDREMEISYDTFEGRPVIANWDYDTFVRKVNYDSEYPLRLSFDFGTILCGVIFFQYIKIPEYDAMQMVILDELILEGSNTPELAAETVRRMKLNYMRAWEQNHLRAYCDPNGDRPEETVSDKSLNTSIKILQSYAIYPSNRKFGTPESTELIETVFATKLPNGDPAILIDPKCQYIIKVCGGGLHYPDKNNTRPGYYEKDGVYDHGGDMVRYAISNCFTEYDLTGNERKQPQGRNPIYENYTGRLIGYKERDASVCELRRGGHRVHSI